MPTPENPNPKEQSDVMEVDPERLRHGTWSHEFNRQIGEGDICLSYSGDVIAMDNRVRKPFRYRGGLWVTTGVGHDRFKVYQLIDERLFDGAVTTYGDKVTADGGDCARHDPRGFYHGMAVKQGGKQYILCGPPVAFVAGDPEPTQGLLFG